MFAAVADGGQTLLLVSVGLWQLLTGLQESACPRLSGAAPRP